MGGRLGKLPGTFSSSLIVMVPAISKTKEREREDTPEGGARHEKEGHEDNALDTGDSHPGVCQRSR